MKELPIIVANESWAETLPDWILKEIQIERMITSVIDFVKKDNKQEQVGDAEVLAWTMTASNLAPLSDDLAKIHLYLATKIMRRVKKIEVPENIKVEELTEREQRRLRELRDSIFRSRGGKAKHIIIDTLKEVIKEDKIARQRIKGTPSPLF